MLHVSELEASYGQSQVLFDIGFEVGAGEVVTILGRNGMGKSTTIKSVMGIVRPRAGKIRFRDEPIHGLPSYRIANLGIGLVPEGRQVFPNLTVRENLIATARTGLTDGRESADWNLEAVLHIFPELEPRLDAMGSVISGGEQQMTAIGRALMTNPRLLILDEATEGLAPLVRSKIWQCLRQIKARGLSILIVDQNLADLVELADRHYVIQKGRVVWSGTSDRLQDDSQVREQYLGV